MVVSSRVFFRLMALAMAVLAAGLADVTTAYAQSSTCSRLQSSLRTFDRNGDFRNIQANTRNARDLARQVQAAESSYIRNGCNADAKAGRTLTRECQGIGRTVLKLRDDYANVSGAVETANAVAQQREAILQELARFGCGAEQRGSSATFSNQRQGIFDRIFGNDSGGGYRDGDIVEDDNWGYGNSGTVRTVCVRLSDGYFWPVSYATLPDMVGNDAAMCKRQCPGTPVDIYYYDNPGQEPEQMRNMFNQPYSDLPNAFRYRREYDSASTCRPEDQAGNVSVVELANGQKRQFADLGGNRFALPLPDPRRSQAQTAVAAPVEAVQPTPALVETAQLADIPLPRVRPRAPGETPIAKPIIQADKSMRLVQFGDKVVRVVGPDTPYAQPAPAGT
ncbi:DUF2865 domain-containing protein [Devosia rhodophyticola]|uniref:DUF2865 domain-containing protein n=1 Tax=Devosia rhodophyticola TaxID=3026423 RepID=A0ABY7YYM1_9HYPH|nr:DUF2865 domain-containing protein [Devosia rhodophyticola]WDR06346.1 DUF2865 domain-containing protein [Devosia rhodophyticola]